MGLVLLAGRKQPKHHRCKYERRRARYHWRTEPGAAPTVLGCGFRFSLSFDQCPSTPRGRFLASPSALL